MSLADAALALRDEQLEARVVHHEAELATSPELDASSAQVVADVRQMQAAARESPPPSALGAAAPMAPAERARLERELIQRLEARLARVFRAGTLASVRERKLADPHMFSDACDLVCDAVYDFLYSDGLLDLSADWRARLAAE